MSKKDDIILRMIEEMTKLLGERLKRVILYGSMARGDSAVESDYDCIMVVDRVDDTIADIVDEIAGDMLIVYGAVLSIITISEKQYSTQRYNPLYVNVGREGLTVWPKTA